MAQAIAPVLFFSALLFCLFYITRIATEYSEAKGREQLSQIRADAAAHPDKYRARPPADLF